MTDEKSLIVQEQRLTPDAWRMIQEVAPAMQASRYFNVPSPEAAMAIMLKGYELGFSLTASFEFIKPIDGVPSLSPRGALALVQQSPNFADMKITDKPDECTVWMKRKNGFEYEITFSMDDAKRAKVVKDGSGWDKYPANMLRWRAVGFCIDVVFPDVIGGMKRADEMGAEITPEGDVWIVEEKTQSVVVEQSQSDNQEVVEEKTEVEPVSDVPQYNITELAQLMELVKDSDILEVWDGAYPTLPDEINMVVHRLIEKGLLVVDEKGDVIQAAIESENKDVKEKQKSKA